MKKILTFVFIISMLLLLLSCGANYHLRKAERQINKAIIKGAVINRDTIFKEVPIITDRFVHDTIVERLIQTDTLTIDHIRYKVRLKYDTLTRTEFVQVECKPDTIIREVPVQVTRTIYAPDKSGRYWWLFFILLSAILVIAIFKKR